VDESGVFSADIIPPRFSMLIYHLGMNSRPVCGRSSEKQSHPIDRNNNKDEQVVFWK
jgi:hypothetical protein